MIAAIKQVLASPTLTLMVNQVLWTLSQALQMTGSQLLYRESALMDPQQGTMPLMNAEFWPNEATSRVVMFLVVTLLVLMQKKYEQGALGMLDFSSQKQLPLQQQIWELLMQLLWMDEMVQLYGMVSCSEMAQATSFTCRQVSTLEKLKLIFIREQLEASVQNVVIFPPDAFPVWSMQKYLNTQLSPPSSPSTVKFFSMLKSFTQFSPQSQWLQEQMSIVFWASPLSSSMRRAYISSTVMPSIVGYRPTPQQIVPGVLH